MRSVGGVKLAVIEFAQFVGTVRVPVKAIVSTLMSRDSISRIMAVAHYHRMAVAVPKKSALLIKLENTTQDFSYLTWMVMNCRKRQSSISLGQVLSHIIKKSLVVVL